MPVDAAQTLIAEHRPAAAGESAVVENLLVDRIDLGAVDPHRLRPAAVGRQELQPLLQGGAVDEIGMKAMPAVDIAQHQAVVTGGTQLLEQGARLDDGRGDDIALEEVGCPAVRIEQITVLLGAVQRAVPQGRHEADGLVSPEQAGAQHGHLAFEHRGQAVQLQAGRLLGELEHVVGVIQPVRPEIKTDGMVGERQGALEQAEHVGGRDRRGGPEAVAVDVRPIVGTRAGEQVEQGAPVPVANGRLGGQVPVGVERGGHPRQQGSHRAGDGHRLAAERRQQGLQTGDQQAAQVAQRDHRHPEAHQRVVGIIPLGALGVHPDAAPGHEVGQAGENENQEFFREIDVQHPLVGPEDKARIRTEPGGEPFDRLMAGDVELKGDLRVLPDGGVVEDAIRHVGVAEEVAPQPRREAPRMEAAGPFQQPQQVDDLMIPPIANRGPGIVVVRHLPLDAGVRHPVGIVAIDGGGVDKLGDDAFEKLREAEAERLPILEDVAPVALVVKHALIVLVAHADAETIPRPARIAVAPAEGERQEFERQAFEIAVTAGGDEGEEFGPGQRAGQSGQEFRVLGRDRAVPRAHEGGETPPRQLVPVDENAAAHDIEQDVGKMVRRGRLHASDLEAVGGAHQRSQRLRGGVDRRQHRRGETAGGQRPPPLRDDGLGDTGVGHHHPSLGRLRRQRKRGRHGINGAHPAPARFRDRLSPVAKRIQLGIGQQDFSLRQAFGPYRARPQGFHGNRAVNDSGRQGIDREGRSRQHLGGFIGIRETTALTLQPVGDAGRKQVAQPINHADQDPPAPEVFQFTGAHQAVGFGGGPAVAEGEAERAMDFLEPDPVALDALIDMAGDLVQARRVGSERFPEGLPGVRFNPEGGERAGDSGTIVDAVDGLVGEKRVLRVDPAGGDTAVARHKQPEVRRADDVHEERRNPVAIGDAIIAAPKGIHKGSRDPGVSRKVGRGWLHGGNLSRGQRLPGGAAANAG